MVRGKDCLWTGGRPGEVQIRKDCGYVRFARREGAVGECLWSCLPRRPRKQGQLQRLWGTGAGERLAKGIEGTRKGVVASLLSIIRTSRRKSRPPWDPRVVGERVSQGPCSLCPDFIWQLSPGRWPSSKEYLEVQGKWQKERGEGWENVEGVSITAGWHNLQRWWAHGKIIDTKLWNVHHK